MNLYEILVPCQMLSKPVRTRHHKRWDEYVRKLAGGLTILKPAKGQWINEGKIHEDRVIPVRIACTNEQIKRIMKFSLGHYKQLEIMAYKISEEVLFERKK